MLNSLVNTAMPNPTIVESALIDHLIPAVLTGLMSVPQFAQTLVLKGGSAIRHCYFPYARFSNDLDFSTVAEVPTSVELHDLMQEAANRAQRLLGTAGGAEIEVRERLRAFRPVPMRTFDFSYAWSEFHFVTITVEVSLDEVVIAGPSRRQLTLRPGLHANGEIRKTSVLAYSLDEIVAEKMRAVLQWTRQLHTRGRSDMPVARTYFDLHWLFKNHAHGLSQHRFDALLYDKCLVRDVSYSGVGSFFDSGLLKVAGASWHSQLAGVVDEVPDADGILQELSIFVAQLFSQSLR